MISFIADHIRAINFEEFKLIIRVSINKLKPEPKYQGIPNNHFKMMAYFVSADFSFSDYYGRTVFFNELKFGNQADITNIKIQFV